MTDDEAILSVCALGWDLHYRWLQATENATLRRLRRALHGGKLGHGKDGIRPNL